LLTGRAKLFMCSIEPTLSGRLYSESRYPNVVVEEGQERFP